MATKTQPETTFVKFPGVPMRLGEHIYILAPLPLGAGIQVYKQSQSMSDQPNEAMFEAIAKVVHQSLLRNYPDITYEQLINEMLDTWNFREAYDLVVSGSGIFCAPTQEVPSAEKYQAMLDQRWQALIATTE